MSLKIRFRFDGKCICHPATTRNAMGFHRMESATGAKSLYVIHLYTKIAQKKAQGSTGIVARASIGHEELGANHDVAFAHTEENA